MKNQIDSKLAEVGAAFANVEAPRRSIFTYHVETADGEVFAEADTIEEAIKNASPDYTLADVLNDWQPAESDWGIADTATLTNHGTPEGIVVRTRPLLQPIATEVAKVTVLPPFDEATARVVAVEHVQRGRSIESGVYRVHSQGRLTDEQIKRLGAKRGWSGQSHDVVSNDFVGGEFVAVASWYCDSSD